jgi:hypothetical protein
MINTYLETSREFQPIIVEVTANGVTTKVTTGVQYVVVPKGTRLEDGTPATPSNLDGDIGFYTDGLTAGYWDVGARVTTTSEQPFIHCGTIRIK